jgi:hypothetical protein
MNCLFEKMKAHMLEVHTTMTRNLIIAQKPNAFDYGTNGVCKNGTYGSS